MPITFERITIRNLFAKTAWNEKARVKLLVQRVGEHKWEISGSSDAELNVIRFITENRTVQKLPAISFSSEAPSEHDLTLDEPLDLETLTSNPAAELEPDKLT